MALRSLSLCSGVGGLDIGVDIALGGVRPVCYVERELSAAKILAQRMEEGCIQPAPIWSDLATFDGSRLRGMVDIVTAGFPCPDYSLAGNRAGRFGEHGQVWDLVFRTIRDVEPPLVVLENVVGIRSPHRNRGAGVGSGRILPAGLWFVLGDMASLGYDAEWLCLRASDVGAPHHRDRWFCLAWLRDVVNACSQEQDRCEPNTPIVGNGSCALAESSHDCGVTWRQLAAEPENAPTVANSDSRRRQQRDEAQRPEAEPDEGFCNVADAIDTTIPNHGRGAVGRAGAGQPGEDAVSDAVSERCERRELEETYRECARKKTHGSAPELYRTLGVFPPTPGRFDDWGEIIDRFRHLAPAVEPGFRCVVDGVPVVVDESRAAQLRALGNAVVPLQAAVAVRELLRRAGIVITG